VKGSQGYNCIANDGFLLASLEYDPGPETCFGASGEARDGSYLEAMKESLLLKGTFKRL
jgi:hypothetical protein